MAAILLLALAATIAAACTLLAAYRRRVNRELRELDEGLPAHSAGRVRAGRKARRGLYRDLVLLLVVNAPESQTY